MPDVGRVEPPAPPEPTLRFIRVVFDTGEDDKDADTAITVELLTHDDRLLARYYDVGTRFPDQGWVVGELEKMESITPTDVIGCKLKMTVDTQGDDDWRFWWRLQYGWGQQPLRETTRISTNLSNHASTRTWNPNIQPG